MPAGSIAKISGSGQGIPGTSAAVIDVGTIDTDPDSILTEVSAGRFQPDSEGYYLITASGRFNATHNNRVNIMWQIERNSTALAGTGGSGYARNSTNRYAWTRCGAILYFNGTTDYFEVTHSRDTGAGTPAGSYDWTRLKVVQLSAGDANSIPYGRYGTPTSGAYSGTTPNVISGWDVITETDTAVIELQAGGSDIRLKEANRPYLIIYGLQNSDSGNSRTTRVSDVTVGGTRVPHSAGYAYQRDAANQNAIPFGMALVHPGTANQDVNVRCWGYDLTLQGTFWGTFVDSTWVLSSAAAQAGVMVVALPTTTEIAIFDDNTANQLMSGSATATLTPFTTTVTADAQFTRDSASAVTVTAATEVLAYSGYMQERTASSGTRQSNATRWVKEGVALTDSTEFGSYLRGDQGSQDTPNAAYGSIFVDSVAAGDTFQLESFDPGTDDGNNDRTSWGGAFFIDLSSLASVGGATAPGAPTIGTATAGDSTATANWTAPVSDGGSAITGYLIERNVDSAGWVTLVADTATTATTYVDNTAVNGTSIQYRVSAINSVGTGAASAASNAVVPSTTPGAPTIGTATAGDSTATANWTAPVSDGGSSITGYLLERNVDSAGWTTLVADTGVVTTYVDNTAVNGTSIQYRVSAINSVGTGSASAASNAVTPTAPSTFGGSFVRIRTT